MDSTSLVCWNIHGLNSRDRRDNVRTLVNDIRANIVGLVETKFQTVNQWLVFSMLGMNYSDYAYAPVANTRGGILVATKGPEVQLSEPHIGCFSATVAVSNSNAEDRWWLTVIYGAPG
jgi:exonuclease III